MGLSEQTAETLATLRDEILRVHSDARTTAVDRIEIGQIAVETGYVHGEITAKIWTQSRGRNQLHVQTIRGVGLAYVDDVLEAIADALVEVDDYYASGLLP